MAHIMELTSLFWIFLWSGICFEEGVHAKQWFVSRHDGTFTNDCGLKVSIPCKTIQQVNARASDGDVINIDGTGTSHDPYPCENGRGLDLAGLAIHSYNTRAFISCKTEGLRFLCNSRKTAIGGVSLDRITFVNTSLHLFDCSLKLADCSFMNSSVPALTLRYTIDSERKNVQLDGCNFQNNSASIVTIYCDSTVNLNISNTTFAYNKLLSEEDAIFYLSDQNVRANHREIAINFTEVKVSQNICTGKACFEVFADKMKNNLVLVTEMAVFEKNVVGESIFDIHGFSNLRINFKSTEFLRNTGRAVKLHNGDSLDLKIEKSMFSENGIPNSRIKLGRDGGAVVVNGFTQNALVFLHSSIFNSNKGGCGGACAYTNILGSLLLDITNCQFLQNEGRFSGGAVAVGNSFKRLNRSNSICIHDSEFSGNKLLRDTCPGSGGLLPSYDCGGGAVALYVSHMGNLSIVNDTFKENQAEGKVCGAIFAVADGLYSDVEILNCEFLRNWATEFTGTLELTIVYSFQPRITLENLTFIKNGGSEGVAQDIFIRPGSSYVVLRLCKIQNNFGGGIRLDFTANGRGLIGNVSFLMENTIISKNIDFTMVIISPEAFQSVYHLRNVLFVNNNCYNYGWSCIYLTASKNTYLFHLEQIKFLNNFAYLGVIYIAPSQLGESAAKLHMIINNTEIRHNSGGYGCTLKLLNVYSIEIQNSNFIDNFGGVVSSHINIEICPGNLKMWNTTFYQSVESQVRETSKDLVAFIGFLAVTQSKNVKIRNSSFILHPFVADSKAIVVVEGAGEGILDGSVRIESPINTKLNMRKLTQKYDYQDIVTTVSVSFSTQRCPVGTYSIRRGIQSGYSAKEPVNCYPCPDGGNCSSSLAAQPNFWGYPSNDTVTFQLCPEGYCCLPTVDNKCLYDNNSYLHSGCQGNRTGILCGQCKQNFTEGLFTKECVRVKDCTQSWYLVVFFLLTSLFAFYLVRKPPVFEVVGKHLTWFIPRREEDSTVRQSASPNYGFLKIIFYFYQVAGVLTVSSYGVRILLRQYIVLPFANLLDFRIYANNNWKICPWPVFTPLLKIMFQVATVMTILLSIPVIYLLHSTLNKLRKRRPTLPPAGPYLGAVLELVLLGYSAVTGTTVKLLNCVSIQEVSRWYYDARFICWYQWWQQAAFVVIALNLLPFIFTLYFASLQLYQGKISGKIFLLVCILPFPYLLLNFVNYVKKKIMKRPDYQEIPLTASLVNEEHDTSSSASIKHSVLEVLCGPFTKPQDDQSNGRIYWESILTGRRFLIIAIDWWQLKHALMRSVCLTILCLVFLLHHISQKPYAQSRVNVIETVSLAILVIIGVLNVGLASAGSDVSGINEPYVSILLTSEAVLLVVIPILFAFLLTVSLVSQIVRVVIILLKAIRAGWLIFKRKYDTQLSAQDGDGCLLPSA